MALSSAKPRSRPLLWTLALLVAAGVWWYASIYRTKADVLDELVQEEAALRERNSEALETLTQLEPDTIQRVLTDYERQLSFMGGLLPIDTLAVELLPYVTEAASTRQVQIQNQRPVVRHREGGLVVDGMTVTVQGGYHQVAGMMTDLLALPRITHLREVSLKAMVPRGAPADSPPVTEGTFTLVTFSRGVPTALPVEAAPPPRRAARPMPRTARPATTGDE